MSKLCIDVPDRTVNGVGLEGGLAKASELTGCSVLKEFLYPKCRGNKNFFVNRKRQNLERAHGKREEHSGGRVEGSLGKMGVMPAPTPRGARKVQ